MNPTDDARIFVLFRYQVCYLKIFLPRYGFSYWTRLIPFFKIITWYRSLKIISQSDGTKFYTWLSWFFFKCYQVPVCNKFYFNKGSYMLFEDILVGQIPPALVTWHASASAASVRIINAPGTNPGVILKIIFTHILRYLHGIINLCNVV